MSEKLSLAELRKRAYEAVEQEKRDKADMKAKGWKFFVSYWIHGGGDDVSEAFFCKVRPTDKEMRALLKRKGSAQLNDFNIEEL